MNKIFCAVLVVLCIGMFAACARFDTGVELRTDGELISDSALSSSSGSFTTSSFTAVPGGGDTIKLQYDNQTGDNVTVLLFKAGWPSDREVLAFTVGSNSGAAGEYAADAGTYYVKISPSMGKYIRGSLHVRQISSESF